MNTSSSASAVLALLLLVAAAPATGELKPAGIVKSATGEATVAREGARMAAAPGQLLYVGDVLTTGPVGTLGVVLRDDSALSLASSASARLEEFIFEPAQGKLGMVLRVIRGTVAYLSGRIAKLAPASARIETPVATLGIRGTRLAARIVAP